MKKHIQNGKNIIIVLIVIGNLENLKVVISALTAEVITEVNRMTNADKFKSLFGIYATELWAMPEKDFLKWINSEAINCSEIPNN